MKRVATYLFHLPQLKNNKRTLFGTELVDRRSKGSKQTIEKKRQWLTSMSSRLRILLRRGILFRASSTLNSSFDFCVTLCSFRAEIDSSDRRPRCFGTGKCFSKASGGWIGMKAVVASVPAYLRMVSAPPGCS